MDGIDLNKNFKKISLFILIIFLISIFSGCTKDKPKPIEVKVIEETTVNTSVSILKNDENIISMLETATTSEPAVYIDKDNSEFTTQNLSSINENFKKSIVIVGDSIAKGFGVYARLDEGHVLAEGSVGTRNIHEFKFKYTGIEMDILDVLKYIKPKYIYLSMGLNDVNISTKEEFKENYLKLIDEILLALPSSSIIVTSITPVTIDSEFTKNEKIDEYNEIIKKLVIEKNNPQIYFVNASKNLKDESNNLKTEFSSGDGIHLAPSAYDYLLSYMLIAIDWIKQTP